MAEDAGGSAPQAGKDPQAQAAAATAGQDPDPKGKGEPEGTSSGTEDTDPKALKAQVDEARREAAASRTRATKAEKELEDLKAAQLTDEQKREQRLADLERKDLDHTREKQELTLRYEIAIEAGRAGVDPRLAIKLVDTASVEWDENGGPKNLGKVLEELVKEYPQLKPGPEITQTATGAPARQNGGAKLTREAVRQMTSDEINARWPEVEAVLSEG